ncbi:hypothetical protein CPT_Moonbeam7 [Bacillus phage Moonbeam]|uniref:Uncharacterized protein n=1 Tax=Bacillus phage Moonbeam TaxID=1540091 RepID=A0A0A0RMW0_9CAUD|nr:hypothetical protein CPT_Moonbeam7 [Bacillus phage Moonbeam]AIW03405.1 hypothetical protein CPT_Moonbeam7 [Bacillus phage Moonbeam]
MKAYNLIMGVIATVILVGMFYWMALAK